jgi:hypothetical protein
MRGVGEFKSIIEQLLVGIGMVLKEYFQYVLIRALNGWAAGIVLKWVFFCWRPDPQAKVIISHL